MYTLFETPNPKKAPRYFYMGFEAVRRRWKENVARLQGHWKSSGYAVSSEHVLSKLVGSFSIPLYDDVRKYRDAIIDMTPQLCMGHGIAAPTNGSITIENPGWFYGLRDKEYLLSVSDDFDAYNAAFNWAEQEPVKVLRHTLTDLNMALPNGSVPDVADGYVIIAINIPLLAVMYWGWSKTQLSASTGAAERIQQFIGQYVLPGLLPSQTTVAFFNRILHTLNEVPVTPERRVNSIAIATNYTGIDRVIQTMLSDFKNNHMTFTEIFGCIPTINEESLLSFIQTPDTVIGRQNQWALEAAYIPYASFALNLSALFNNTQNQMERNYTWRLVQRVVNDRLLDAAPRRIRNDLRFDFDTQVAIWTK